MIFISIPLIFFILLFFFNIFFTINILKLALTYYSELIYFQSNLFQITTKKTYNDVLYTHKFKALLFLLHTINIL